MSTTGRKIMESGERDRLLELRKTFAGTDAQTAVTKLLYDDPRTQELRLVVKITDPLLEFATTDHGFSGGDDHWFADQVLQELAPEWFSKNWGASWWINSIRLHQNGAWNWEPTEEPFPTKASEPLVTLDAATTMAWSFDYPKGADQDTIAQMAIQGLRKRMVEVNKLADAGKWDDVFQEIVDIYDESEKPTADE